MVAPNQIHYNDNDDCWTCRPCSRGFNSELALHQHCRNAAIHTGEWCERCEWLFVNPSAKHSHLQNSNRHHICPNCHVDFTSLSTRDDHMESKYLYCRRCDSYIVDRRGCKEKSAWTIHQVCDHFMCMQCGIYFQNQNNVDQHQRVHLPRDKECYGCYRMFPSLSAMMIHFESGTCSSQVTMNDIDGWTSEFNRYAPYVNRVGLILYKCPVCESRSNYLSGLMQHLESNACHGSIDGSLDGLVAFLERKIMNS